MGAERFAVLILTHGRPDNVITVKTLRRQGYTGDIYIVVDNEDTALPQYVRRYGDKVIVFDKLAVAQTFDEGDNFEDRRAVVYARNASYEIAQRLGLDYFLQLDDDYCRFLHKFDASLNYRERPIKNLDRLFESVLRFYKTVPAVTVALAQNGDFMGGKLGNAAAKIWMKRKAMNTFFCSVQRPLTFVGRVNEDVNTYVVLGGRGILFLTTMQVAIMQARTQKSKGGMTELYLDQGTYRKSFYPVMYAPSCVKISQTGYVHRRIHHRIMWEDAVPCIVSERYRRSPCKTDESVG
jgi:hypothetical protein